MAQYDITSPDGQKFRITAPDDATEQDVMSYAQQNMGSQKPTASPAPPQQFGAGDYMQQVAQGGTFGLSDEIGAGLAAGKMALDKGRLSDLGSDYNAGLEGVRTQQKSFETAHPYQSLGLQLLGGAPAALGSGGALAARFGGNNLATRMLANSAAGAASGAAYGFGTGEGQDNRLQSAGQGAMVGGALGAALPIAPAAGTALVKGAANTTKTIGAGLAARDTEALQKSVQGLKSEAGGPYKEMRKLGDQLTPESTSALIGNITTAVNSAENKFIPELNPKTLTIINAIKSEAENGTLGVSDIDQYRRLLSRVGGSEDGFSAGVAKRALDETINGLGGSDLKNGSTRSIQLLNQGRAESAKSFRFEDVADILSKADGDPNRIKAGLQRFVAEPENLKGFNVSEISALREAARTGVGENILKAFGKFGFDFSKSGTGNTVLPALLTGGGLAGVPGGLPLAIGGTIARQGQKYIARGKAENALRMIENRQ